MNFADISFGKPSVVGGRRWTRAAAAWFAFVAIAGSGKARADASFDCVLYPALTLKLGSPVASIIESVDVDRGDLVRKGQPVARLESTIEAADVALQEAKAADPSEINANQVKVNLAKISLSRQSLLEKTEATPEEKYDQANADYQLAQQQLALAQLSHRVADLELKRSRATLEERIIRSPIDGVVTQRSLGPGEYVNQDGHILTVAQIDPLHVETFLPIRYFGHIHVGDTAMVRPDDPIGGERKGVVSVVDQVFDEASGTFGIRLNLPNPDRSVPGGLRCRVTFSVPEVDGAPAVR